MKVTFPDKTELNVTLQQFLRLDHSEIVKINCSNSNLTELPQRFALSNLTYLDYSDSIFASLSPLFTLIKLLYRWTQLISLPPLPALTNLNCSRNQLTELPPLHTLTALIHLNCSFNELTSLPSLHNLTALTHLYCNGNQLTSLPPLHNLTALTHLICYANPMTKLPFSTTLTLIKSNITSSIDRHRQLIETGSDQIAFPPRPKSARSICQSD